MKKLSIILLFLISFYISFGQTQPVTPRANSSYVPSDARLQAQFNFYAPRYLDTATANLTANIAIDSCGAIIFTYDVMSLWVRGCSPKRWILVGGGSVSIIPNIYVERAGSGIKTFYVTDDTLIHFKDKKATTFIRPGTNAIDSSLENYLDFSSIPEGNLVYSYGGTAGNSNGLKWDHFNNQLLINTTTSPVSIEITRSTPLGLNIINNYEGTSSVLKGANIQLTHDDTSAIVNGDQIGAIGFASRNVNGTDPDVGMKSGVSLRATATGTWTSSSTPAKFEIFIGRSTSAAVVQRFIILEDGKTSLAGSHTPTAWVHIPGGTATIPQLKLDTSILTTTPQVGAIEFDGAHLYVSIGSTRYQLDQQSGGGSGTVNSGTQYRIAYYATTGTAVSEAAAITASRVLISDANGVPTHSTITTTTLSFLDATSSIQTQINTKAPTASPTFTGTVTIPTPFTLGAVSVLPTGTELNFVDGVTSAIQTQLDGKQPLDADLTIVAAIGTALQQIRVNAGGTALEYFTPSASVYNLSYDAANREVDISGGGTSATIPLALDDGATEGLSSFTAADFTVTAGNVAIDYANGQVGTGSVNGFLLAADHVAFSAKQAALSGTGIVSFSGTTPSYNTTSASIFGIISDETGGGGVLVGSASPTFTGTVVIPTPFTLGATSVTSTGTQVNYLNAATGTTGTASTNLVFSTSPSFSGTMILSGTVGVPFIVTNTTASSSSTGASIQLTEDDGAALGDGHRLGGVYLAGSRSSGGTVSAGFFMEALADGAWSSSSIPTKIQWGLGISGGTTRTIRFTQLNQGQTFIGGSTTPTAWLHLPAGSTGVSQASLKIIEGSRQTTPEDGTINYVSNNIEFVETSTVYILAKTLTATATLDFGNTLAGTVTDLTITVTGAADGDVVTIGVPNGSYPATGTFTGWISASNTATIRYANNSLTLAQDPASGTFRVSVIKY